MNNTNSNNSINSITLFFDVNLDKNDKTNINIVDKLYNVNGLNVYDNKVYEDYFHIILSLPLETVYRYYILEYFTDIRILFYVDSNKLLDNYELKRITEKYNIVLTQKKYIEEDDFDDKFELLLQNMETVNIENNDMFYHFAVVVDKYGNHYR
jgi:hypothetical protein